MAWLQSRYDKAGPGGGGADYINCPLDKSAVRRLHRRAAGRREDRVQGVGGIDALFRGLPADRGDGRARPRDAALRPDEAGRPHQPASTRREPYAVVQLRQDNALGTLWNMVGLPDQAEARRAGARLPPDPGARERRVRAARRPAPQHLPQQPEAARSRASPEGRPAAALRRPDHRRRGLCRKRRRSGCSPGALPRPSGSGCALSPPPPTTALGALLDHITGGHLSAEGDAGARSFQPMNVNFGLFPPIAAPLRRTGKGRAAARASNASGRWPRVRSPISTFGSRSPPRSRRNSRLGRVTSASAPCATADEAG